MNVIVSIDEWRVSERNLPWLITDRDINIHKHTFMLIV